MLEEPLSEFDKSDPLYRASNVISEPGTPRSKEMLVNPNFKTRMKELSKAYVMRDQYDNCYNESKPCHFFKINNSKAVSRAIQTNVLELLGVDDID